MAESDQRESPDRVIEAQRFVTARYGCRATGLRPLGAGEWSHAYAFTLDGRKAVIRFGRHGEDFLKDQLMSAYGSADLPVPSVRETGPAGDGYFAVSDRAPGRLLNDLDGANMRAALPGLFRALERCRLSRSPPPAATASGYPMGPLPPPPGPRPCWLSARRPLAFLDGGPPWPPHPPAPPRSERATPGCKSWSPACRRPGTSSTGI